jgi:hypothetical protein
MAADKNDKGEYALYDQGKLIGYAPVVMIGQAKVIASIAPIIQRMIADAAKAGVNLTLASGLRTWGEQMWLRQSNAPATKKTDQTFLLSADSSMFAPATGKPGWSNHQDGKAYDFNVTGLPAQYKWLVLNAYKYGFIRTVKSERWHWEFMPDSLNPFWYVGITDTTWDGHAPDLAKLAAEIQAGRVKRFIQSNPGKTGGLLVGLALLITTVFFFVNRSDKKKEKKK